MNLNNKVKGEIRHDDSNKHTYLLLYAQLYEKTNITVKYSRVNIRVSVNSLMQIRVDQLFS